MRKITSENLNDISLCRRILAGTFKIQGQRGWHIKIVTYFRGYYRGTQKVCCRHPSVFTARSLCDVASIPRLAFVSVSLCCYDYFLILKINHYLLNILDQAVNYAVGCSSQFPNGC
jgi:hypothetical protein